MDRNRIGYLAGEGEWLLAEGVRVADVGEDDPLALLLELGRAEVELPAHGVLHLLDVLVQVLVVQPLPPHLVSRHSSAGEASIDRGSCAAEGKMGKEKEVGQWGDVEKKGTKKQGSRWGFVL